VLRCTSSWLSLPCLPTPTWSSCAAGRASRARWQHCEPSADRVEGGCWLRLSAASASLPSLVRVRVGEPGVSDEGRGPEYQQERDQVVPLRGRQPEARNPACSSAERARPHSEPEGEVRLMAVDERFLSRQLSRRPFRFPLIGTVYAGVRQRRFPDPGHPSWPVRRCCGVTAGSEVVQSAGKFDSQRSGHAPRELAP
jgi:hypothetical protein